MSGAPWATRWPETTWIRVIWPSTCGWTVVDRSDLRIATYSVASSTGARRASAIETGVGGIAGAADAAGAPGFDWHAAQPAARMSASAARRKRIECIGL